jgi:polyhydroxyalkanoic acid synthase PhaR subunit
MATASPEPILNLKQLYDRTEQLWTKPLQTLFGTESFVAGMSATRESVLHQQKASRELLERHWDTLRLPTKTDHARLAAQVVNLENKVDAMQDQLDRLEGKLDALISHLAEPKSKAPAGAHVKAAN